MEPFVQVIVGMGIVVLLAAAWTVLSRRRRRRSLHSQAKEVAKAAPAPAVPTKELIDLALKQREEALAARRREMEEAAMVAAASPRPEFVPGMPSRMKAPPEPEIELPPAPEEPRVNPVQKMALDQWESVQVVGADPKTIAPTRRPTTKERELASPTQATPKEEDRVEIAPPVRKPSPRPLELDWGEVEVRRDVKKR